MLNIIPPPEEEGFLEGTTPVAAKENGNPVEEEVKEEMRDSCGWPAAVCPD